MKILRNVRDLGLGIREARRAAGMTQQHLAQTANVSRRWLIAIENGTAQAPDATKILDTLRALDLSFGVGPAHEMQSAPKVKPNQQAKAVLELMNEL